MYNGRAAEFISYGELFYRCHKTCYFFKYNLSQKGFLKEREKILQRYFHPLKFVKHCSWNVIWHYMNAKLFRCMQIWLQQMPVRLPTCWCLATFPLSDIIHLCFSFTVARQHVVPRSIDRPMDRLIDYKSYKILTQICFRRGSSYVERNHVKHKFI